jgi:hypothetical protein
MSRDSCQLCRASSHPWLHRLELFAESFPDARRGVFAAGRPNDHLWPSEAVNEDGRNLRFAATSLLRLATSTMPW